MSNKTREEIREYHLRANGLSVTVSPHVGKSISKATYAAMEEYAKQQSIAFAEFIKDNSYTKGDKGWYKYYIQREDFPSGFSMSTPVYEFLTIEELYSLFIKSQMI